MYGASKNKEKNLVCEIKPARKLKEGDSLVIYGQPYKLTEIKIHLKFHSGEELIVSPDSNYEVLYTKKEISQNAKDN